MPFVIVYFSTNLVELVKAISSTQAYADAVSTLSRDRNGYFQRGLEYRSLSRFLCEETPERLLVFHHYDRRGFLPISWRDALLAFQSAGWQVVVSTSNIEPMTSSILDQSGVYIARRLNIGLCVGAYRDLAKYLIHYLRFAGSALLFFAMIVIC